MKLRFITILAKYPRDIRFVDLIICNGAPLTKRRQNCRNKPYVNYSRTHRIQPQI